MKIPAGIPRIDDYKTLLTSEDFARIEQYSNRFIQLNRDRLTGYGRKWVADSLHQWSRQWEYPFVFQQVEALVSRTSPRRLRVLDAGSGVSFFPYFLTSTWDALEVTCMDHDKSLAGVYSQIDGNLDESVDFVPGDLRRTPFPDGHFQVIYCISVLEHIGEYERVIEEFQRLLSPGGLLVVTFDISIDGSADIRPKEAQHLLNSLRKAFPVVTQTPDDTLLDAIRDSDILTTQYIAGVDKHLLPWKSPLVSVLSCLRNRRIPRRWGYKNLTCSCHALAKEPCDGSETLEADGNV
ncbi:MAG: methyltransferase domain-containing protein [Planctomycetes bacterium]|nr:methyltransferase domain-containing protein [Planctomycetota bacterium]